MKNIRLIVDNDRKAKQPYFIKKELQTILNLYAKMVSNGTWKDYSLYTGNKEISFNVYNTFIASTHNFMSDEFFPLIELACINSIPYSIDFCLNDSSLLQSPYARFITMFP